MNESDKLKGKICTECDCRMDDTKERARKPIKKMKG